MESQESSWNFVFFIPQVFSFRFQLFIQLFLFRRCLNSPKKQNQNQKKMSKKFLSQNHPVLRVLDYLSTSLGDSFEFESVPKEDWVAPTNVEQETLLFRAALFPDITFEFLDQAIQSGSNLEQRDYLGNHLINFLCQNRGLTFELLQKVLAKYPFDLTRPNLRHETVLHHLCQSRPKDFSRIWAWLLSEYPGLDINAPCVSGETPLCFYCNRHTHPGITRQELDDYFVSRGARVDLLAVTAIVSHSDLLKENLLGYVLEICDRKNDSLLSWRCEKIENCLANICIYNPTFVVESIVDLLVNQQGFSIETKTSLWPPLIHLCKNEDSFPDQILLLIRFGAQFQDHSSSDKSAFEYLSGWRGKQFAEAILLISQTKLADDDILTPDRVLLSLREREQSDIVTSSDPLPSRSQEFDQAMSFLQTWTKEKIQKEKVLAQQRIKQQAKHQAQMEEITKKFQ